MLEPSASIHAVTKLYREAKGASKRPSQRATKETHERAERASVVSGSARASVAA